MIKSWYMAAYDFTKVIQLDPYSLDTRNFLKQTLLGVEDLRNIPKRKNIWFKKFPCLINFHLPKQYCAGPGCSYETHAGVQRACNTVGKHSKKRTGGARWTLPQPYNMCASTILFQKEDYQNAANHEVHIYTKIFV